MGNRILPLEVDTAYHVYNRGFNKQTLFYDALDYRRFLQTVVRYQYRFRGINIKAYCLLPNHFHFLLLDKREDSLNASKYFGQNLRAALTTTEKGLTINTLAEMCEISSFMQKLQQSYAAYFNIRYRGSIKKGLKSPIFEGRFQAKAVVKETYLEQLVTYIEHNAVKHELVGDVNDWPYSSWEPDKVFNLEEDFFSDFT